MAGNKSSGNSVLSTMLTAGSLCAGAYHGYMDASGNPLTERLETTLTWTPTAAGAVTGGLAGLVSGAAAGGVAGKVATGKGSAGAAVGGLAGVVTGTAVGAVSYGALTLFGYGLGYMVGAMLR